MQIPPVRLFFLSFPLPLPPPSAVAVFRAACVNKKDYLDSLVMKRCISEVKLIQPTT